MEIKMLENSMCASNASDGKQLQPGESEQKQIPRFWTLPQLSQFIASCQSVHFLSNPQLGKGGNSLFKALKGVFWHHSWLRQDHHRAQSGKLPVEKSCPKCFWQWHLRKALVATGTWASRTSYLGISSDSGIPPESSCCLKEACGCIQESIRETDWYSQVKSSLLENAFIVFFRGDVSSWKPCCPRTLSLMHGQTQALGAACGISLRKIFVLPSFVTETRGKCRSRLDWNWHRGTGDPLLLQQCLVLWVRLPREHSRANHGLKLLWKCSPGIEGLTKGRSSSTDIFSVR